MNDFGIIIKWFAVIVASTITYFIVQAGTYFIGLYCLQNDNSSFLKYLLEFISFGIAGYVYISIGFSITELNKRNTISVLLVLSIMFGVTKVFQGLISSNISNILNGVGVSTGVIVAYFKALHKCINNT